jgi:hypothetical protein
VVPLCYQSTADLMPAVKTVLTLAKVNPNIVLLINNTDPASIDDLKAVLAERFPSLPLFVINRSKYIARLADDGQTAFDLFALGGLHKFALRHLLPQLKAFYSYLDTRPRDRFKS